MVVGRISLFFVESDSDNSPIMKGVIKYSDGSEDQVTLWENEHPRVVNNKYYSGQVYHEEKKNV